MAFVFLGHEIPGYDAKSNHELANGDGNLHRPPGSYQVEKDTPANSPSIELVLCTQSLVAGVVYENAVSLETALSDKLHEAVCQHEQNEELEQSQQEGLDHQPSDCVHALTCYLNQINAVLEHSAQCAHLASQEETAEGQEHAHDTGPESRISSIVH